MTQRDDEKENIRLNEFDKAEWFGVCRKLKPGLTEGEYDKMWSEFVSLKKQKELQ